eukprot:9176040-Pyramimonas_sp.AAC.1
MCFHPFTSTEKGDQAAAGNGKMFQRDTMSHKVGAPDFAVPTSSARYASSIAPGSDLHTERERWGPRRPWRRVRTMGWIRTMEIHHGALLCCSVALSSSRCCSSEGWKRSIRKCPATGIPLTLPVL